MIPRARIETLQFGFHRSKNDYTEWRVYLLTFISLVVFFSGRLSLFDMHVFQSHYSTRAQSLSVTLGRVCALVSSLARSLTHFSLSGAVRCRTVYVYYVYVYIFLLRRFYLIKIHNTREDISFDFFLSRWLFFLGRAFVVVVNLLCCCCYYYYYYLYIIFL